MIDRLKPWATSVQGHVAAIAVLLAFIIVSWADGKNTAFVESWGGSIAAIISTWFLIFKSQGYWSWTIGYSVLWGILFFNSGLSALGAFQFVTIALCVTGAIQWYLVKRGIGINLSRISDRWVTAFATVGVGIAIYAYWPSGTANVWWWLEIGSVLTALVAIWMDAFRYKGNWWGWTASNLCSWPLFWHQGLTGPFVANFIYQTMNFAGFYQWWKEERRGDEDLDPRAGWSVLDVIHEDYGA